jgi:hypothetical protein
MEDIDVPQYIRDNAARGLRWYEEGLGGDGLVPATIREAEDMAAGRMTLDKATRMAAWLARHMTDLDAPAANPAHPAYPSPGVVASALWGGGTKRQAERAMAWSQRVVKYRKK